VIDNVSNFLQQDQMIMTSVGYFFLPVLVFILNNLFVRQHQKYLNNGT